MLIGSYLSCCAASNGLYRCWTPRRILKCVAENLRVWKDCIQQETWHTNKHETHPTYITIHQLLPLAEIKTLNQYHYIPPSNPHWNKHLASTTVHHSKPFVKLKQYHYTLPPNPQTNPNSQPVLLFTNRYLSL